jgi:hypothetical protein
MKRIAILTGFYGSGKTEVSANLAIRMKCDVLIDLDVINPYFRSRELDGLLRSHGVRVISSALPDTKYADMPYIGGEVFLPFRDKSVKAVLDLGGNDLGAKLLRQFSDYLDEADVDCFVVVNPNRMETATAEQIAALVRRIEGASGVKVTGLINNTNLLEHTDLQVLKEGEAVVMEASRETAIPIVYTMVPSRLKAFTPQMGEAVLFTRYFQFH